MIIKLELNSQQLDALHRVLKNESNAAEDRFGNHSYYFRMIEVKSEEMGPNNKAAVPAYVITLEVLEVFKQHASSVCFYTPLSKISNMFAAIGLFPEKDGVTAG